MKTYLKLATVAIALIAPAGTCAADPPGAIIKHGQEAQQEPQRIPDPVEFFDKRTGKVKVWYWQYQLARAVELADPARGQAMQDRLVKLGYPAAFDNAGSLLLHEKYCEQHCINEAVKLFQKGAAYNLPLPLLELEV